MDLNDLYREEAFTDRRTGTIRRLSPVKPDGSADSARRIVYMGETQLLTSAGALPLSFEIEAKSLDDAAGKYAENVKRAFQEAMEEIQKLRRQAASGLVIPESGGGLGQGGLPRPSKLTLP
jgi:hypothetical protein